MWVSQISEENLTNEIIDRLLFEGLEDTGGKCRLYHCPGKYKGDKVPSSCGGKRLSCRSSK